MQQSPKYQHALAKMGPTESLWGKSVTYVSGIDLLVLVAGGGFEPPTFGL